MKATTTTVAAEAKHSTTTSTNVNDDTDADADALDDETRAWQEELQALLSPEVARAKTEALLAKLSCVRFRGEIPLTAGPPQAFGCYVSFRARQPPRPLFRSARESAKITSFMAGTCGSLHRYLYHYHFSLFLSFFFFLC